MVPITSRGGSIIVRDLLCSTAQDNVYLRILPDLISHARRTSAVLSIGATFRSATIFDSCDEAQLLELDSQLRLARDIQEAGVGVIIETPGHARPRDIQRIATLLRPTGFPIMPLGPIPTDCAIGQDHVSAAIGAALLGLAGCAHILAAVTREEHTGGVPSIASTIEAVEAARVAAHIIDLETLNADQLDMIVAQGRAEHRSCVSGKKSRGCARCADVCPL
jgi:phosphomethylpyrimidine synthase